jgi:hypothetical protein
MSSFGGDPEKQKKELQHMKTVTQINEVTMRQRLQMLTTPPPAPVKGRGAERIDLGLAEEWAFVLPPSEHYALVSVRQPINRFGKLGTPKHLMVSPQLFNLFN